MLIADSVCLSDVKTESLGWAGPGLPCPSAQHRVRVPSVFNNAFAGKGDVMV